MNHYTLSLSAPVHEMAREEISKQLAFLARGVRNVRFVDHETVEFDAPDDGGEDLLSMARDLCERIQRGLRRLERKVMFQSALYDAPTFQGDGTVPGITVLGTGQVALEGLPLALFRYFDRRFAELGQLWDAVSVFTPTLIPARVLARCDYFQSFPSTVTFACHLPEDPRRVERFRARHSDREDLDDRVVHDLATPEACLSPAVCYHIYHLREGQRIGPGISAFGVCGKCFRYESSNFNDLRRLWDFTMREIVLLGPRDDVLSARARALDWVAQFLDEHRLSAQIRTASDPFFLSPGGLSKTYFQLTSETKYEIAIRLPNAESVAVGSLNNHTDFFGKAFGITIGDRDFAHSVCMAFGLERWVHAFLCHNGTDLGSYPESVRRAPELSGGS